LIAFAAYSAVNIRARVGPHCERKLTTEAWVTANDPGIAKRIARCDQLNGRTGQEVSALIGPPAQRKTRSWRYDAGTSLAYQYDLVVLFDGHGRVQDTRIHRTVMSSD
jgi:enterochelin esterase-like enzyme